MANSYINIYLHIVFAVKHRESLSAPAWQPHFHAYIAKSLNERGHHAIAVGGTANHVHILLDYSGKELISEMIRDLKVSSTNYANKHRICQHRFLWQPGYGCFSVSATNKDAVVNYIRHQNEHHNNRTLRDEIQHMLDSAGVEYDNRYIFEDVQF